MRTSPLAMRLIRARRAPALLVAVSLLFVLAGCGGDDDGGDAQPTTTAPAATEDSDPGTTGTEPDDATTTTSEPESTEPGGPVEGDDAVTLTVAQAEAQLDRLLAVYRQVLLDAQTRPTLDEQLLAGLQGAFTAFAADAEFRGLEGLGAPASLNPDAPEVDVSEVSLGEAVDGCVNGSASIDGYDEALLPGTAPPVSPPFWFKLVPAETGSGWRLDFLAATGTQEAPTNVSCS